ncbi:unnamed protein product [Withania somnifera]
MATRPIFVFMLLATLAFTMVAESSLSSHIDHPALNILVRTDDGLDDLTVGRIGDTLFDDQEMMMPSDYRAMARNAIPCNRRGTSYYQCTRMQRVRPYRRGCSKITRCKRR